MELNSKILPSVDRNLSIESTDKITLIKILKEKFHNKISKKISTAILLIEFDDLSRFNDALGFNVDERLVINISNDIMRFLNSKDILVSTKNHQLIIMQDHTSTESAGMLAKQIIHLLSEPCVIDDHMFYIQASIGISLYPLDGDDADKLIELAGNTIKYVQKEGKRDFGFAKDYIVSLPCEKSVQIMADLPAAIDNGEIYYLYQPQYSHAEKRFVGAELLSRWDHPQYGEISPEVFIPIAEQSGMIGPMTIKALVTALKAISLFKINGINDFSLSVNISPIFLMSSSFNENIEFLMEQYDLSSEKLNFEITEEILLKNTDNLIKTLNKLKALNIDIEIDDFGTGYTSLQHLAYLPIDSLKVDKSFISGIDKDEKKQTLFKAIVDMSHALNINVIAEGVENELENNLIKNFNEITVQGYFYSDPIHLDKLVKKVKFLSKIN